jgi:hypothetical protein
MEPFSIEGVRHAEAAGTFDLTKDCARTSAAKRKAKRVLKSFADLDLAMGEMEAA